MFLRSVCDLFILFYACFLTHIIHFHCDNRTFLLIINAFDNSPLLFRIATLSDGWHVQRRMCLSLSVVARSSSGGATPYLIKSLFNQVLFNQIIIIHCDNCTVFVKINAFGNPPLLFRVAALSDGWHVQRRMRLFLSVAARNSSGDATPYLIKSLFNQVLFNQITLI